MTVQTEAKITEMLSNTQTLVERTNNALSVIDKANAKAVADINKASSSFVKTFSTNIEKTVGAGGDFTDLESALQYAQALKPANSSATLTIKLLANFVLNKTYIITNSNLTYLTITSDNAEITCDFSQINNAMFIIKNTSVYFQNIKFKCINTTNNNLFTLYTSSFLLTSNFSCDGALVQCIKAYHNSTVKMTQTNFLNIKQHCIYLTENATALLLNTNATNANDICYVNASRVIAINISTNHTRAFNIINGSLVNISGTIEPAVLTLSNIAENTLTANGILFK